MFAMSKADSLLKKGSGHETSPLACLETTVSATHIWLECFLSWEWFSLPYLWHFLVVGVCHSRIRLIVDGWISLLTRWRGIKCILSWLVQVLMKALFQRTWARAHYVHRCVSVLIKSYKLEQDIRNHQKGCVFLLCVT